MEDHNEWIKRSFDDGVFLVAGNLYDDPFVAENVVNVEILEITSSKTDERLKFLLS